jgi:hypothetical protein
LRSPALLQITGTDAKQRGCSLPLDVSCTRYWRHTATGTRYACRVFAAMSLVWLNAYPIPIVGCLGTGPDGAVHRRGRVRDFRWSVQPGASGCAATSVRSWTGWVELAGDEKSIRVGESARSSPFGATHREFWLLEARRRVFCAADLG